MSNLLGSIRERHEQDYRNNQLDLERQTRQSQVDFQNRELGLRQQEALWNNANKAEHVDIARKSQQDYSSYLDWMKKQPNAAQLRDQDLKERYAQQQAAGGYFDDANHVKTVYPDMGEGQAGLLADMSQRARQQIEQEYNLAKQDADTLNKQADIKRQIKDNDALANISWMHPLAAYATHKEAARIKPILDAQLAEIAPLASSIVTDAKRRSLVSPDPVTNKFVPVVPQPQWTRGGGANARGALTPEDQAGGVSYRGTQGGLAPAAGGGTPEDQAGGGAPTPPPMQLENEEPPGTGLGPGAAVQPEAGPQSQDWMGLPQDMPPAGARGIPAAPSDNPPYGMRGNTPPMPPGMTSGTGNTVRKYSPLVYDRARYWTQKGMKLPQALAKALQEEQALAQ